MSLRAPIMERALDLPPLYSLTVLREIGDAFAHACTNARELSAGALIWVGRHDAAEFAVVLEPEVPLAEARLALYAGMNSLADALATHAPPSRPITFDWPDAILVDGIGVGGGRLGWPEGTCDDEIPDWLVFSAITRTTMTGEETSPHPMHGALEELGFEAPDPGGIIASFARHFMSALHQWSEVGFEPIAARWLERLSSLGMEGRLADNGDLIVSNSGNDTNERKSLAAAVVAPTWINPATGRPWL